MPDDDRFSRMQAAGELLQSLLLRPPYLDRWQRLHRRGFSDRMLNQSAVAQVIADYLWDSGERPETEISLPRGLKDRVHRALRGEVLTAETLDWFIGAFQMSNEDAHRLRSRLFSSSLGQPLPIIDTLRTPQLLPIPQRHRTVSVFERHIVGPDGRTTAHRTTRAIVACMEGVDSYPYRFVPGACDVKVLHGGRVRVKHEPDGSSPIVEIKLNTPLRMGEIASLEYEVEFFSDAEVAREYRRVAHAQTDNIDIVVQFDLRRIPGQVWWAVWDDYKDGNILEQEEVLVDSDACVHRFIPFLRDAAAGFYWKWLPQPETLTRTMGHPRPGRVQSS
jgi:hypothetical protein